MGQSALTDVGAWPAEQAGTGDDLTGAATPNAQALLLREAPSRGRAEPIDVRPQRGRRTPAGRGAGRPAISHS